MTAQPVQLTAADFQDAMDFLNLVFGAHRPHNFERLLPAVYQPTDDAMACNYAVRENGRIKAIVGMFPMTWQLCDATLSVVGIGGVSTHPKSRGAGYMKLLMKHCLRTMREHGCQISYLGGQRQRYAYFGYERCGHVMRFTFSQANVRHTFGDTDTGIHFELLTGDHPDRLAEARALHDAQPAHCRRNSQNFLNHLHNWHARPYAAVDGSGDMVGYLVSNASLDSISELVTATDAAVVRTLGAWVAEHGDTTLAMTSLQPERVRLLGQWCESVSITPAGNWRVFDWPSAVGALLTARARTTPLTKGRINLGIGQLGCLRLQVTSGDTRCAWTNRRPDVQCNELEAMRLLFGPARPSQVVSLPPAAGLLEQWCPLPLHWPRQDGV